MTNLPEPADDQTYPHVDTLRGGMSLPAENDAELNELLLQERELQARILTSLLPQVLGTDAGRAIILAALPESYIQDIVRKSLPVEHIERIARDTANRAAREAITSTPVPPHSHRAQNIIITTLVRGLSKIGMAIGAVIGGLLAWWLLSVYAVTTVTFGTPDEMHSASVVWTKSAIAAVVIALFATLGALFGPRKKQQERMTNANIVLDSAHTHQGRVPAYSAIAATARRNPKDGQ